MDTNDPIPEGLRREIDSRGILLRDALRFALPCFGLSMAGSYLAIWIIYQRQPPPVGQAILGSLIFASLLTSTFTTNRIIQVRRMIFPDERSIIHGEVKRVAGRVAEFAVPATVLLTLAALRYPKTRWAFWIPVVALGVTQGVAATLGYFRGRRLVRRMQAARKIILVGSLAADEGGEEATEETVKCGESTPATKNEYVSARRTPE